jgi:hypothetical protein
MTDRPTTERYVIDEPSRDAPHAVWRDFLKSMRRLPQDQRDVQSAIATAKAALARPERD